MPLPDPEELSLADAAKRIAEKCGVELGAARAALVRAASEGALRPWGYFPRDPRKAEYPETWVWKEAEIDWDGSAIQWRRGRPSTCVRLSECRVGRRELDEWLRRAERASARAASSSSGIDQGRYAWRPDGFEWLPRVIAEIAESECAAYQAQLSAKPGSPQREVAAKAAPQVMRPSSSISSNQSYPAPQRHQFDARGLHGAEFWEAAFRDRQFEGLWNHATSILCEQLADGEREAVVVIDSGSEHPVPLRIWRGQEWRNVMRSGRAKFAAGVGYATVTIEGRVAVQRAPLAGDAKADTASQPRTAPPSSEPAPSPANLPKPRRGPRPRYDWEAFHIAVAQMVGTDPDGYPETQAELERRMAEWCAEHWGEGNVPTESTIRQKVAPHYRLLEGR